MMPAPTPARGPAVGLFNGCPNRASRDISARIIPGMTNTWWGSEPLAMASASIRLYKIGELAMRRSSFGFLALAIGLLLTASTVRAHHSFAAEYDSKKPVTVKGIITKVDWMNPHVYFYLDATDQGGKVTNWAFEMGPPQLLQRAGWTRTMMKVGDEVIVEGTLAKDGSNQANARSVTMANTGKKLGAGSSENTNP